MFFEAQGEIWSCSPNVLINVYPDENNGKYTIELDYVEEEYTLDYKNKKERDEDYTRIKDKLLNYGKRFSFEGV